MAGIDLRGCVELPSYYALPHIDLRYPVAILLNSYSLDLVVIIKTNDSKAKPPKSENDESVTTMEDP
jgi:hypothetical protein